MAAASVIGQIINIYEKIDFHRRQNYVRRLRAKLSAPIVLRFPYRGRQRMLKVLGPKLGAMTTWSSVDTDGCSANTEDVRGGFADIFARTQNVRKMQHYFPIYESILDRSTPIRLLEIGNFYGGSLKLWRECLHPESVVVQIDLNAMLFRVSDAEGVTVAMGENGEGRTSLLARTAEKFGPFNAIIDSAGGPSSQSSEAFRTLFDSALVENGAYMVEDTYRAYWTPYRDTRIPFMGLVGALIDALHAPYQILDSEARFSTGDPLRAPKIKVPAVTRILDRIEIHDSAVVFHRADRAMPNSLHRP